MQHPSPRLLRQQPREKRRHRSPTTPQRAHNRKTTHLDIPAQQPREHGRRARVHGSQQQPHNTHRHALPHDIRHKPHQKLEQGRAHDQADDGRFFADLVRRMRQREPADRDPGPEPRRHVPDAGGVAVPVRDQERDHPARDADFGALVGEDEQRAQDRRFVLRRLLQLREA